MTDKLHIAYATDDGYAQHVAVSLYSLFRSAEHPELLSVFILANSLSDSHKRNLSAIAEKFGKALIFIDISNIAALLPEGIDTANLSISTYCRLFVAELLPDDVTTLLYLDCDTYINDDISDVWRHIPQNGAWDVAGVEDTMYPDLKAGIGLEPEDLYLNAGILLINLRRWRETGITAKFIDIINRYDGAVPHLDQGVLNGVFRVTKVRIPLRYNVQAPIFAIHTRKNLMAFFSLKHYYDQDEIRQARENPAIVHFTSFFLERPWFEFCLHPLRHLYRDTLSLTPYSDVSLQRNPMSMMAKFKDWCFRYFQPVYLKIR